MPALIKPSFPLVVAITVASGICLAGLLPASNGLFVQALPPAFRARAFGVIQSGLYLIQGAAVTVTGALASQFPLHKVVGFWGVGGVAAMVLISVTWPSRATINDAIAANRIRIAAEEHAGTAAPGHEFGEDTIDLGRPSSPLRRRPAPAPAGLGQPGPLPATDGPTVPIKPLIGEGPTVPLTPSPSEGPTVPIKPGLPPPPPGHNSGPGGHSTKPTNPASHPSRPSSGRPATRGDRPA